MIAAVASWTQEEELKIAGLLFHVVMPSIFCHALMPSQSSDEMLDTGQGPASSLSTPRTVI